MNQDISSNITLNFADIENKVGVAKETRVLNLSNKKIQVTYSLN